MEFRGNDFAIYFVLNSINGVFKSQSIIDFVDKGDFCLYSAGLLSSAIFILTDNKENIKKWHNHILYPFSFFLIAVAAALYLAIYIAGDVFKDTKINISSSFVRWTSMILIILSMIVILRSLIIDFRYRPKKVDVAKKQHEAVQDIMDKLGN